MSLLISRRRFLTAASAVWAAPQIHAAGGPCLFLAPGGAQRIREELARNQSAADLVRKNAASALQAGPWSVTSHRPENLKIDPHEYYSEGPYWWPDPKNPNGPYIRRDGDRNPARFMPNRRDIGDMSEAVLALGMGASLLGDARAAERGAKVLSIWFLDAPTRMKPDLEYGQAVRGHNTGRGTGIIDTVSLIQAAQGVALLEESGKLDKSVAAGVRQWYADYLKWMTTSEKGLDEKKAQNNHGTWWTTQVAAFSTFTGDDALKKMCWDRYRAYLVPTEIKPDGSCPREEARTRSLSYSTMNLDAFALLCRLAQLDGQDLWRFKTPQGIGVEKAFQYLMPYVLHPELWKKPQITGYEPDRALFPGVAGAGLRSQELLAGYKKLPRATASWIQFIDLVVRTQHMPA
jgi:alginate lyase